MCLSNFIIQVIKTIIYLIFFMHIIIVNVRLLEIIYYYYYKKRFVISFMFIITFNIDLILIKFCKVCLHNNNSLKIFKYFLILILFFKL